MLNTLENMFWLCIFMCDELLGLAADHIPGNRQVSQ